MNSNACGPYPELLNGIEAAKAVPVLVWMSSCLVLQCFGIRGIGLNIVSYAGFARWRGGQPRTGHRPPGGCPRGCDVDSFWLTNSPKPSSDSSRPNPEFLTPPNGSSAAVHTG